ncbi:hypothetical protein ACFSQ7_40835 [Paenibacillus rhizoplanae]
MISAFELEAFHRSKQNILRRLEHRTSDEAFLFNVTIPSNEHSLERALSVYTKGLQAYLETDHFPLLFLYDGRRYEEASYYNTVGEFIDFVPLFIDTGWNTDKTMRSVKARLDLLKDKKTLILCICSLILLVVTTGSEPRGSYSLGKIMSMSICSCLIIWAIAPRGVCGKATTIPS